jgi:hypothetical protein
MKSGEKSPPSLQTKRCSFFASALSHNPFNLLIRIESAMNDERGNEALVSNAISQSAALKHISLFRLRAQRHEIRLPIIVRRCSRAQGERFGLDAYKTQHPF